MNLIKQLFQKYSSLTPEEIENIQNTIETSILALEKQKGHYISASHAQGLQNLWKYSLDQIDQSHISKKSSLYPIVQDYRNRYKQLHHEIDFNNREYMERERIRCSRLLSDIDGKALDLQQRNVVVCDADRTLVLAGAGSGKTLTIAGKVKYLCQEKHIPPEHILLIAFTRKSAEEMTERISGKLSIPIQASTFHKLGLDIITKSSGKRPEVVDDLYSFLLNYFENYIVSNPDDVKILIEYFAYYLHIPADLEQFASLGDAYDYEKDSDLETLKSKYEQKRYISSASKTHQKQTRTLRNEHVKSLDEVSIANFLYLNGVEYEYERLYPFKSNDPSKKSYRPDFYLPKYDIYLEHFGIDKDGKLPWLPPVEEKKYQEEMEWKRNFHKQNGTKLIETYSYYSSNGCLLEKLDQILKEEGVQYHEPNFIDIFNTIYTGKSEKYFLKFICLCGTFITLFKSNGYQPKDLEYLQLNRLLIKNPFFRQRIFMFKLLIAPILDAYELYLKEKNSVDFSDMINSATDCVLQGCELPPYKWVIIDEFQDISISRYRLIQAILKKTNAKLLCVGDDWQSIYRFAGSDISIFVNFEKYFGPTTVMRLEQTYRNSQQLIDIAGSFVMKNEQQLKKQLRSNKLLDIPIIFMCYRDNPFVVLQKALNQIIQDFGANTSILLLGRTNYDVDLLYKSGLFLKKPGGKFIYVASPETNIHFLTVHKSKGLEADNVILLNFENSTLGFPNKIADDPILDLVLTNYNCYPYAEERRLLYVALTRTKNRVFILVNENKPSVFMQDFKAYNSVSVFPSTGENVNKIQCPRCKTGHLIVRKNNSNANCFISCSNFPQCCYTLNNMSVLTNPVSCPECGGFLVKRKGRFGTFYGCTNYPTCQYTRPIKDEHSRQT